MAARLAPFAERHGVSIAIRNQVDGNDAGTMGTSELAGALALSPAFTLKLDVGAVTASNRQALDDLRRFRSRVSYVVLTDRLRSGGVSQPFGEGDTPIVDIVRLLDGSGIPAFVEYDYLGLRSPEDEVAASLRFVAHAIR
jgi:sugar phosphate isomerase/epimerase